jgi:Xaa-Pro dipeptidase
LTTNWQADVIRELKHLRKVGFMLFTSSTILDRKNRTARALDQIIQNNEVVLVHAGSPIQKPGGHDQTYPFLPHPDYFWLTGVRRTDGVSAYSKAEGWIDFVQPITREEKIWEGGGEAALGKDLALFDSWMKAHKFERTFHLGQHSDRKENDVLETYNEVRRVKDAAEIELIKNLAVMANAGYKHLKKFIRPGVSERQIQIEYEAEVLRAGSDKFPYDTIIGTGTNAAVLHAIPTSRIVKDGEMILIDAGADVQDYCVDITRMFAANGTFSTQQQAMIDIVTNAQKKSIEMCTPGTEWSDVHLASARVIAGGLKDLGILNSSVDEAIESGAISVFFPHGVGHMVGLRVRDVGAKFNPNPKKYAGARLRVDFSLRDGYLMTIEPGMYFIHALLNDSETRSMFKNQINWSEADKWTNMGGVRLEDDILVTNKGPVNLTEVVPK